MLRIENNLRELLKNNRIQLTELCKVMGITTAGLYKIYKRNSIETKYLELISEKYNIKICDILGCDCTEKKTIKIDEFVNNSNINDKILFEQIISGLKEVIKSKDELIEVLKNQK